MKPTAQRSIVIARPASCTLVTRSCSSCRGPVVLVVTRSWASCDAARNPNPNSRALYTSVLVGPTVTCSSAAGITAANPTTPAITPSFEFASTSSVSLRTTEGTSADFDTT